ncbi:MAG TPA: hypothetical protein VGJ28_13365 [Micromonosporaceae bacterium]|jgi:hypothetical protein
MYRTLGKITVGAALMALAVAGCSSSGGSAPSTSGGQAKAAAGGGGGGGGGKGAADGLGHPVNVCSLLPVATVAQVTGEPLTVAKEDDTVAIKLYTCDYTSTDGTTGLDISVLALDAAAGFQGTLDANGSGAKPISGLGDKAFSAITGVEALYGNVSITVSDLQSDSASEQLIKMLQPKL